MPTCFPLCPYNISLLYETRTLSWQCSFSVEVGDFILFLSYFFKVMHCTNVVEKQICAVESRNYATLVPYKYRSSIFYLFEVAKGPSLSTASSVLIVKLMKAEFRGICSKISVWNFGLHCQAIRYSLVNDLRGVCVWSLLFYLVSLSLHVIHYKWATSKLLRLILGMKSVLYYFTKQMTTWAAHNGYTENLFISKERKHLCLYFNRKESILVCIQTDWTLTNKGQLLPKMLHSV